MSRTEVPLLAVGLAALTLGAGAVGWAIGHGGRPTSAVVTDQRHEGGATSTATRTTASAPAPKGDPVAGKKVFVNGGCGSCHTFAATGASGAVGPNLDQVKLSAVEILAWVKDGKGAMPSFKAQLSGKELADVAAFLAK
jgi:mono/diheme cytochrome c family protein